MAAAGYSHFLFENYLTKIEKIGESKYTFEFKNVDESNLLIRSLYELKLELKKIQENEAHMLFEINCDSIQTINQYRSKKHNLLTYNDTLNCCLMIGDQMKFFYRNRSIPPYINIDNIIVIDDKRYFFMNDDFIEIEVDGIKSHIESSAAAADESNKEFNIYKKNIGFVQINKPYTKHFLMGNELFNLGSLPSYIHSNDWIYSLGVLGIYLLTDDVELQNKSHQYYLKLIEMIQDTKLYFMLSRCLYKHPQERKFLYI